LTNTTLTPLTNHCSLTKLWLQLGSNLAFTFYTFQNEGDVLLKSIAATQWLQFRQDGTQEIYFRVPSKTTPTTILVAVIKAHRNRKTNLNA